jgi:hypothetical protein
MKIAVEDGKMKVLEIIQHLPESKLTTVIDFVSYLRDREESKDLWRMQMSSKAYQDWLSPENDIYDEVFKDEVG